MSKPDFIPVSEPLVGELEARYVAEAVQSGWISSAGEFYNRFEREWANYCGQTHGISVSNGTTALQVAIEMANIGPGDEVILPTLTIISCILPILRVGATPVVVDCDPQTWCMDVSQVAAAITPRTRAIMPVHIFGHPVDMDPLLALAAEHNLLIIEDAAEVHGAQYLRGHDSSHGEWQRCGSFGGISTFSFYGNKLVTTGEGGMVLTSDDAMAARARSLRDLCHVPGQRFLHEEMGHNFRFTNVQAALGCAQIERLDETLAKRREMGRLYTEALSDLPQLQLPVEMPWARHVYWVYAIQLRDDAPFGAREMGARLREKGVDTRPVFVPLHQQPVVHKAGFLRDESHPVAEKAYERALYLPSGTPLTNEQIARVCDAVHEVLR